MFGRAPLANRSACGHLRWLLRASGLPPGEKLSRGVAWGPSYASEKVSLNDSNFERCAARTRLKPTRGRSRDAARAARAATGLQCLCRDGVGNEWSQVVNE